MTHHVLVRAKTEINLHQSGAYFGRNLASINNGNWWIRRHSSVILWSFQYGISYLQGKIAFNS